MRRPLEERWFVMVVIAATLVAGWTWVFLYPSVTAFTIQVGATATAGGIFHWTCVEDDKRPDLRGSPTA